MNMREKIARALAKADGMHPEAVSNDEDEIPIWVTYLDMVDAALDALMEPTEEMVSAAHRLDDPGSSIYGDPFIAAPHDEAFRAMIQAAKDGK